MDKNIIIINTESRKNPIRVMIPICNIYKIEEVQEPKDGDFDLTQNAFDITFSVSKGRGIEIVDQSAQDGCESQDNREYLDEDKTFVRIYKPNRDRDFAEFLILNKERCVWEKRGKEVFTEKGFRDVYLPHPNENDAPFVKLVKDIVFKKWKEETMDTYVAAFITLNDGTQINSLTTFDNLLYKIEVANLKPNSKY